MSETKWTPGPWTAEVDSCAKCRVDGTQEYVINEPPMGAHGQFAHGPDAYLAAAAPDLYAACEEILKSFAAPTSAEEMVIAAMKKARGEA